MEWAERFPSWHRMLEPTRVAIEDGDLPDCGPDCADQTHEACFDRFGSHLILTRTANDHSPWPRSMTASVEGTAGASPRQVAELLLGDPPLIHSLSDRRRRELQARLAESKKGKKQRASAAEESDANGSAPPEVVPQLLTPWGTLGAALEYHRQQATLTQAEAAKKAGLKQARVSQLERDAVSHPLHDEVADLLEAYRVDASVFDELLRTPLCFP